MVTGKGKLGGVEVIGHRVRHRRLRLQGLRRAVPHLGARHVRGRADAGHRVPSVASKAAGFVALILMVYRRASRTADDVYRPFFWVLAALTMTVGNVLALRQTNIVRMLAYSCISQGGFILMPLVVAGTTRSAETVAARRRRLPAHLRGHEPRRVRRGHRRRPQDPQRRDLELRRPVRLRPGPGRADDDLPRLARRHPAARRLVSPSSACSTPCSTRGSGWGYSIAVIGAVNTVIATAYYVDVMREMWMKPAPDGDIAPGACARLDQGRARHHRHCARSCSACCRAFTGYGGITELAGAFGL